MDNADAPIRYRVARELLKDETAAKKIESELFDNKTVALWLANLKPHDPPQHWLMEHGCFDFNLENAMAKVVQLGLHGGMPQIQDAVRLYINRMKDCKYGMATWTSNFLSLAGVKDDVTHKYMLNRLDSMYNFAGQNNHDIYLSPEERAKLTGVPKNWKGTEYFINPAFTEKCGFCFPFIMDIVGMHRLYDMKDRDIDTKINAVVNYVSTDDFHTKISDGYGILVAGEYASGNPKYNGMGWDPKYPGWFDAAEYMEKDNVPKLLFYAEHIVKYPAALKTKWFNDLQSYFEKYRTDTGTYSFPKEWIKETAGYAVQGHHLSFGENRRKKTWLEIESTFYMQLILHNI